jgi:transcription elongation factor GreA
MTHIQLTKEGFDNLQEELKDLKEIKRPEAVERLHKARSMGDLSENSEYNAAKEGLAFVEGRIQEIETILKSAQIVENCNSNHHVEVGTSVTVEIDGKKDQFQIVGDFEADPVKKKLSQTSPIGSALIGKKVGDWVEIRVPAGTIKYKIVEIK